MDYAGKDAFFIKEVSEEDVEIPGRGTVRIRALTRTEALDLRNGNRSLDDIEKQMISWALVKPTMTTGEVALWQDASKAGEMEPLTTAIARLSGMEKSGNAVKRFPEGS